MFLDSHCRNVEIWLADISLNAVFSDSHCRYVGPTSRSGLIKLSETISRVTRSLKSGEAVCGD